MVAMRRQAATGTDPDALEGAGPLVADFALAARGAGCGPRQERAGSRGSPACPRILTACVRLHHIVAGAHDLPSLARFRTQALTWKVLSRREREIVIGTDERQQRDSRSETGWWPVNSGVAP